MEETKVENKVETKIDPPGILSPQEKPLVKPIPKSRFSKFTLFAILGVFLIVSAGVGTGWFLSGKTMTEESDQPQVSSQVTNSPSEAGIADESTFRDTAEGMLQAGGINGEGTHHLDRNLGESKYVYLTSTVIDLDQFVGKKVQVWGETIKAKTAGWLMDVGKIKVVN